VAVLRRNGNQKFPLHPILGALTIALTRKKPDDEVDLGSITSSHPRLKDHKYYFANAEFPTDLSNMLPPIADRWWEHLGMHQLLIFPCYPTYNFFNKKLKPLAEGMLPKTLLQTLVLLFKIKIRGRARPSS
jgi:hypothetical protein